MVAANWKHVRTSQFTMTASISGYTIYKIRKISPKKTQISDRSPPHKLLLETSLHGLHRL